MLIYYTLLAAHMHKYEFFYLTNASWLVILHTFKPFFLSYRCAGEQVHA